MVLDSIALPHPVTHAMQCRNLGQACTEFACYVTAMREDEDTPNERVRHAIDVSILC